MRQPPRASRSPGRHCCARASCPYPHARAPETDSGASASTRNPARRAAIKKGKCPHRQEALPLLAVAGLNGVLELRRHVNHRHDVAWGDGVEDGDAVLAADVPLRRRAVLQRTTPCSDRSVWRESQSDNPCTAVKESRRERQRAPPAQTWEKAPARESQTQPGSLRTHPGL